MEQSSRFGEEIPTASPTKRRPTYWPFVVCVAVVLGGLAFVWFAYREIGVDPADVQAQAALRSDARFAEIRDAFAKPRIEVSRREHQRIDRFLTKLMAAGNGEDDDALRAHIDRRAFVAQMERSGRVDLNVWDEMTILSSFSEVTDGPTTFDRFQLVSIRKLNDREVIAYLHVWDDDNLVDSEAYRYWLVKHPEQWRLADWESVREGLSEATSYATLWTHQDDPGIEAFYQLMEDLYEVWDQIEQGDVATAKAGIRAAEARRLHPLLHDYSQMVVGDYWGYVHDWKQAKAAYARARDPEATPGVLLGLAEAALAQEDHQAALSYAERYEQCVGPNPNALRIRASAYDALGNSAEAFDAWGRLLRVLPAANHVLHQMLTLATPEQAGLLADILDARASPSALRIELADAIYRVEEFEQIDVLRRATSAEDDSGSHAFVTAVGHEVLYEFDLAARAYQRALEQARGKEYYDTIAQRYFDLMCQMDEPVRAFETMDSNQGFAWIVQQVDDGDLAIEDEAFLEILRRRARLAPAYPRMATLQARVLRDLGRTDEAMSTVQAALAEGLEDDVRTEAQRVLWEIQVARGEGLAAYEASRTPECFLAIARVLGYRDDLQTLGELVDRHRAQSPEDPWLPLFSAQVAAGKENHARVIALLEHAEAPDSFYSKYEMAELLDAALIAQDTWRQHLEAQTHSAHERFDSLAGELEAQSRWDELDDLIALHAQQGHPEGARLPWLFALAKARQQPAKLIEVMQKIRAGGWEQIPRYSQQDWLVRAFETLLRLGQVEEAQSLAELLHREHEDPEALLMLALHRGDAVTAESFLKELATTNYAYANALEHEFMRPLLREPRFLALRNAYPPPLGIHAWQDSVQLLLREANVSPETIAARLAEVFGGSFSCNAIRRGAEPSARSLWIATNGTVMVLLREGLELLRPRQPQSLTAQAAAAVRDHAAVLTLAVVRDHEPDEDVSHFAELAVAFRAHAAFFTFEDRLVVGDEQLAALAKGTRPLEILGERVQWVEENAAHDSSNLDWQGMRKTTDVVRRFDPTQAGLHRVRVHVRRGPVREDLRVRILDRKQLEYGDYCLIGELLDDSQLYPWHAKGRRVRLEPIEIASWLGPEQP